MCWKQKAYPHVPQRERKFFSHTPNRLGVNAAFETQLSSYRNCLLFFISSIFLHQNESVINHSVDFVKEKQELNGIV